MSVSPVLQGDLAVEVEVLAIQGLVRAVLVRLVKATPVEAGSFTVRSGIMHRGQVVAQVLPEHKAVTVGLVG